MAINWLIAPIGVATNITGDAIVARIVSHYTMKTNSHPEPLTKEPSEIFS